LLENIPVKIAISQFKAHCLEIIDKLQATRQPIILIKRDKLWYNKSPLIRPTEK